MENTKVLIVEDKISELNALALRLKKEGYEVKKARNASQAIKQYQLFLPNIVLMDINLPQEDLMDVNLPKKVLMDINLGEVLDGIDVAKIIYNHTPCPIIYTTAHPERFKDIIVSETAGWLAKPFNFETIKGQIELSLQKFRNTQYREKPQYIKIFKATRDGQRNNYLIRPEEIVCIKKEGGDTLNIHTTDGKNHYKTDNLKRFLEEINIPYFMQVERGAAINTKARIIRYTEKPFTLILQHGLQEVVVKVSRSYKKAVEQIL